MGTGTTRQYSEEELVNAFAKFYKNESLAGWYIAKLCDEYIDRTGRLLGLVREKVGKL